MYHAKFALLGLWQLAYRSPQATLARHRLSAQRPHRVKKTIVWRDSREDRLPTHRNNNSEASTSIRRGSYSLRRLKTLKESDVGRLAVQGPKRRGRLATSWVDLLRKNLEAFGAIPRKRKGRKWVVFAVVFKDGRESMTAAMNVGMWHRGVEREAQTIDNAWRCANLRQSNLRHQHKASR